MVLHVLGTNENGIRFPAWAPDIMKKEFEMEEEKKVEFLQLLAEIAYLAIAVNSFTDFCVFFDYSGHVGNVRLDIAKSKTEWNEKLVSTEFYVKYRDDENPWRVSDNGVLKGKRDHLLYILENHDLPYHDLTPVHHMTTTYEF